MSVIRISTVVALSLSVYVGAAAPPLRDGAPAPGSAEIKWDTYGVPHIAANSPDAWFYAFGWAQMQSHGNLILSLYGKARGRAAEYWGPEHLDADVMVHALAIPETARQAYAAQDAEFRRYVDLFVQGMNAYANKNPGFVKSENRVVLPLEPVDVFAHLQSTLELGFIGRLILRSKEIAIPTGSNALALAPAKTSARKAMLVVNPHLPWMGYYTFYEAHFTSRDRNLYGATLVGLPVLTLAFNNLLGWAHTSNSVDGADLYEVEMVDEDRYRFDGQVRSLRKEPRTLYVKEDTERRARAVTVSHTVHGPVLWRRDGRAYAYRSTRALYPQLFKQYWRMGKATTLAEFQDAVEMMQLPLFNIIYADAAGHIMYMWNGLLPARAVGDLAFWAKTVPGADSSTLWTTTFKYERMPQVVDPPSGWVQNSNDTPWTSTLPAILQRKNYPVFLAPDGALQLRSQQLLNLLRKAPLQTFDSMREIKFTNRMELADRLLDDLLRAIDGAAAAEPAQRALLESCRQVLASWDRTVDAESRGAVLFRAWVQRMQGDIFAQPYSQEQALTSPRGLKDPHEAVKRLLASAEQVLKHYGALDVKWGDVYRLQRGSVDVGASGGPDYLGIFHTIEFGESPGGKFQARGGESYSAVIEFSSPPRAAVLLSYGNSSEETSPHNGDQLALVGKKKMRQALLNTSDIDRALVRREVLSIGTGKKLTHKN